MRSCSQPSATTAPSPSTSAREWRRRSARRRSSSRSSSTSTDARAAGLISPYLQLTRRTLAAGGRRLEAAPRRTVLVPLAALQWALVLVVALTVGHEGSLAAVVPQVLVLLPVALVLVYET